METEMRLDRGGREDDGGAHAISGGGDARNAVVNCYYAFQWDRSWTGRPVQLVNLGQRCQPGPNLSKFMQPIEGDQTCCVKQTGQKSRPVWKI